MSPVWNGASSTATAQHFGRVRKKLESETLASYSAVEKTIEEVESR